MTELTTRPAATSVVADKVVDMVARVAAQLETAKTAAQILDIIDMAKIKAGEASGLARMHSAHKEVVDICHKATGDLLLIERAAQCRIAEEYDKAQERGDVRSRGGDYTSKVPKKNLAPTTEDIGLSKKLVHEARKIRDAEREKPGEARKAIEEMVKTGKEPTRASVRRAMKGEGSKTTHRPTQARKPRERHNEIIKLHDSGLSVPKIAAELGISIPQARNAVELEETIRKAKAEGEAKAKAEPVISLDTLSMSAQQKMEAWQRQTEKRLRAQVEHEEREKVRKSWDETVLPHYSKKLAEAERVVNTRKGVWTRAFFRKLLACVHPDRSAGPETLQEIFNTVKDSEVLLCKEAEAPTTPVGLPRTVEELLARRRQGQNGARS